ncbi:MAG: hypothetical protein HOM84_01610 [Thiotrichales bacterium]|jgi:uncharacterized protein|nr:hypothetical protein [Thiotrichales bacterium]MBT3612709.1 hypothetical protein [Thiotrichales bacterium]MBT3752381.1 hypothetical protein [Thiotrichales bacterium]MBT3837116.1 hypothetical protein [Thiotrichales bacterium]MBT4152606.1 hypothetical protein [Thiotrichales bacterium]
MSNPTEKHNKESITLPTSIDPFAWAIAGRSVKQTIAVKELGRLCSMLATDYGEVSVDIEFQVDKSGISSITGSTSASLELTCQRCLEPMRSSVASTVKMALLKDEKDEGGIPEQFESIIVEDEKLSIADFIEDELILALPVAESHPADQCEATQYMSDPSMSNPNSVEDKVKERENPFKVLEGLKTGAEN